MASIQIKGSYSQRGIQPRSVLLFMLIVIYLIFLLLDVRKTKEKNTSLSKDIILFLTLHPVKFKQYTL
jgi:hypothetical protein